MNRRRFLESFIGLLATVRASGLAAYSLVDEAITRYYADRLAKVYVDGIESGVRAMGMLSRVGVSFTDEQKQQIEQLAQMDDTVGAQKIILAELDK